MTNFLSPPLFHLGMMTISSKNFFISATAFPSTISLKYSEGRIFSVDENLQNFMSHDQST